MTPNQVKEIIKRVDEAVAARMYSEALSQLSTLAQLISAPWELRERLGKIADTLELIKRYAFEAAQDPTRKSQLRKLRSDISRISSMLAYSYEIQNSSSIYFTTLRQRNIDGEKKISDILADYTKCYERLSMSRFVSGDSVVQGQSEKEDMFEAETQLFNAVWTTYPYAEDDYNAVISFLTSEEINDSMKRMVISAIMLGGMQNYDERRIELLIDGYESDNRRCSIYSLCGLMLLLWIYRGMDLGRSTATRLQLLSEDEKFCSDTKAVFRQLIKVRDTERISRKVNEEIIPSMMKFRPEIEKFNAELGDDLAAMEENPEWEELLRKTGIEDKLKELDDMQLEGADVMMSTFSHLKSFPFFHDVANWFRSFDVESPKLGVNVDIATLKLLEMVDSSPMLCDSDKYSLAFSLWRMPGDSLEMLKSQLSAMPADLSLQAIGGAQNGEVASIANKFVQDLYRFFNLFRRKSDFYNPFAATVNLFDVKSIACAIDDRDTVCLAGEFFFNRGYYEEALNTFMRLPEEDLMFSENITQKIGFCKQWLGDLEGALAYYEKSELMNGHNKWTLRKLAYCHKALGNMEKAIGYFNRVLEMEPDDASALLAIGYCNIALRRYSVALNSFFKIEFVDEQNAKIIRPVAWCLMMTGEFSRSKRYYDRIECQSLTANDFMNIGNLHMAMSDFPASVKYYRKALEKSEDGRAWFLKQIEHDKFELKTLQVDDDVIELVVDEVIK